MEVHAITRYARMSPKKMRELSNTIKGRKAPEAVEYLALIPRKSARLVAKALKSALANAEDLKEHKADYKNLAVDKLRVAEAVAGAGSTLKRSTPKARGSAGPVLKRHCHIKIVLSDQ